MSRPVRPERPYMPKPMPPSEPEPPAGPTLATVIAHMETTAEEPVAPVAPVAPAPTPPVEPYVKPVVPAEKSPEDIAENWSTRNDKKSGRNYYVNSVTKARVWRKPQCLKRPQPKPPQSHDWERYEDENGTVFNTDLFEG